MKRFTQLFYRLDATTKTTEKLNALGDYFEAVDAADAAWAIFFLCGRRLQRPVPTGLLRQWAASAAGIPNWLVDECYHSVGDLAETIALIVPDAQTAAELSLTRWVEEQLLPLRGLPEPEQRQSVVRLWQLASDNQRLVVMKLMTGAFRVGVSRGLVTKALAQRFGLPADVIAHRLMGDWKPSPSFFRRLIDPDVQDTLVSQPYPFCLANAIDASQGPSSLGDSQQFMAEWKWDGIRGQLIRRAGQTFLWSRGQELMEQRWPEIEAAAMHLPDGVVLDGEILAVDANGAVMPFSQLQRRINRKRVGPKLLSEVPACFFAFDLLELNSRDLRQHPLEDRRKRLAQVCDFPQPAALRITSVFENCSWDSLAELREQSPQHQAEGLMLKHRQQAYGIGRVRGIWWKWKLAPLTIDAVLIYAQKGHGRRSSLYTDYTFAVWDGPQLVPFAKAYSGLSDGEIREVDRFVRAQTRESFGPVRSVAPKLVMELAFEGLRPSKRHKCGLATRFPRIVRWRRDKLPAEANRLEDLMAMLPD